jgi:Flp pilus assembly protein TadB
MTESFENDAGSGPDIKEKVKASSTWLRIVFMILFAVIFYIVEFVLFAVAALQFLWKLFTGEANERLTRFGESLARFTYQIVRFLTTPKGTATATPATRVVASRRQC